MARIFGPRRFGIGGAYMLRRSAQRGSDPVHELHVPTPQFGLLVRENISAGVPRVYNPHGEELISVRVVAPADTNTDEPTLEHGITQQQPTESAQPTQASEPTTSSPPTVTPTQAAAAARIRVAADRKNGRKTADWIVQLAHGD